MLVQHPPFVDEESEAERGQILCSRPRIKGRTPETQPRAFSRGFSGQGHFPATSVILFKNGSRDRTWRVPEVPPNGHYFLSLFWFLKE